jgi:hypothetical protein
MPRKPRLSTEQRRALKMLAGSPQGATFPIMLAHGFTRDMLARLAHRGLVKVVAKTVRAGSKTIEVRRIKITDAGRKANRRLGLA